MKVSKFIIVCFFMIGTVFCSAEQKKAEKPQEAEKPAVQTKTDSGLEIIMSFVSGDVFSGKKLSTGDRLSKGASISSSAQSIADIQPLYPGLNTSLRMKENSELSFSERTEPKEILIYLKKGEASFNAENIQEGILLTILTPVISVSLNKNSKLGLKVNRNGDTKLEMYEGKALFRFAAKQESENFPVNLSEDFALKGFKEKDLGATQSDLEKGDKISVTLKQRDDFLKKKRK